MKSTTLPTKPMMFLGVKVRLLYKNLMCNLLVIVFDQSQEAKLRGGAQNQHPPNKKIDMGSPELTRLWNICPDNLDACRAKIRGKTMTSALKLWRCMFSKAFFQYSFSLQAFSYYDRFRSTPKCSSTIPFRKILNVEALRATLSDKYKR